MSTPSPIRGVVPVVIKAPGPPEAIPLLLQALALVEGEEAEGVLRVLRSLVGFHLVDPDTREQFREARPDTMLLFFELQPRDDEDDPGFEAWHETFTGARFYAYQPSPAEPVTVACLSRGF